MARLFFFLKKVLVHNCCLISFLTIYLNDWLWFAVQWQQICKGKGKSKAPTEQCENIRVWNTANCSVVYHLHAWKVAQWTGSNCSQTAKLNDEKSAPNLQPANRLWAEMVGIWKSLVTVDVKDLCLSPKRHELFNIRVARSLWAACRGWGVHLRRAGRNTQHSVPCLHELEVT